MTVVFHFVGSITFDVFCLLNPTYKGYVAPLPAILALRYARVHICSTYCSDVVFYIEEPVNKSFSRGVTLWIPDIYSDDVLYAKSTYLENISLQWYHLLNIYYTKPVCCGNHLSQRQMITQSVNLLSWISSGKFTRELDKESLLN